MNSTENQTAVAPLRVRALSDAEMMPPPGRGIKMMTATPPGGIRRPRPASPALPADAAEPRAHKRTCSASQRALSPSFGGKTSTAAKANAGGAGPSTAASSWRGNLDGHTRAQRTRDTGFARVRETVDAPAAHQGGSSDLGERTNLAAQVVVQPGSKASSWCSSSSSTSAAQPASSSVGFKRSRAASEAEWRCQPIQLSSSARTTSPPTTTPSPRSPPDSPLSGEAERVKKRRIQEMVEKSKRIASQIAQLKHARACTDRACKVQGCLTTRAFLNKCLSSQAGAGMGISAKQGIAFDKVKRLLSHERECRQKRARSVNSRTPHFCMVCSLVGSEYEALEAAAEDQRRKDRMIRERCCAPVNKASL
mmetsp:Transcript_1889/g.3850  ORF Transcript_1889/g.3850 Transcript_1889/m.3850 type:complete len:365 (-) Transcript_1889:127-1221(-)|eukprot:CAMPEP_0182564056 /NCGR_PEP_ID=MMETSP1324-20130603/6071_1 /TAXON_ID=236786 /ORGANISM="Florenciella sp., Strain RCC1587" /LENGTH=364 /DNA_ID=CAMNT_0024777413 /DNA_START=165 /DNA_END=1259 /DNA_ORIENTATION=-